MKGICPNCENITSLQEITRKEIYKVRGESFEIETELIFCEVCGQDYENPKAEHDPYEKAYYQYRKLKGMVQPQEIHDFRKGIGLTQREMSSLLGWGDVTLSRYENGALQNEAHDQQLKLLMHLPTLVRIIREKADIFSEERKSELISVIKNTRNYSISILSEYDNYFDTEMIDIYSGNASFSFEKFRNVVKFFCHRDGVVKTIVNKLSFYADFLHYKTYGVSITGIRYAHLPYGPVPDQFRMLYGVLIDVEKEIRVREYDLQHYSGEIFLSATPPTLHIFSTTELMILTKVKEYFKGFTASGISTYSHKEIGYKKTSDGELISYQYAKHIDSENILR